MKLHIELPPGDWTVEITRPVSIYAPPHVGSSRGPSPFVKPRRRRWWKWSR